VLAVLMVMVLGVMVVAVAESQATLASNPSPTVPQRPNPGGMPPPPNAAGGFDPPVQNTTYVVNVDFRNPHHSRVVQLQLNQVVRVTVTTTEWGGGPPPDVDLYVVSPFGDEVARDDGLEKDCEVTFVAPVTGQYQFIVVLHDGKRARCTVRY